jgi:hypothetical protein
MYRSRCSFVGAAYLLSYRKTPVVITLLLFHKEEWQVCLLPAQKNTRDDRAHPPVQNVPFVLGTPFDLPDFSKAAPSAIPNALNAASHWW